MKPYLYRLAELLHTHYGATLSDFSLVFPNRRAGLFFQKYLAQVVETPILSPTILTIGDCFSMLSPLRAADPLALLLTLYQHYRQCTQSKEPLDDFIFWGQMMLSDFNELDKHLIDVQKLYANLSDLKEIDQLFDYMSEQQKEAILHFWGQFSDTQTLTEHKEKFLSIWKDLYPIYKTFTETLKSQQVGYEGLMEREAVTLLRKEGLPTNLSQGSYLFVGFNALTRCEEELFKLLQKEGVADFYWDYESPTVCDPENLSSRFYEKNKLQFPGKFALAEEEHPTTQTPIELIGVSSEIGQVKYVQSVLKELLADPACDLTRTAIVLPDEKMLLPLLHSLPEEAHRINITMGYPLSATPVFGFMEHVFMLHQRVRKGANEECSFYYKHVLAILKHQYIHGHFKQEVERLLRRITEQNLIYVPQLLFAEHPLLNKIFAPIEANGAIGYLRELVVALQSTLLHHNEKSLFILDKEYIYQYFTTLNRLQDLLSNPQNKSIEIAPETLFALLRQLTAGISIPFSGEPLNGLQVMGVLETRNLDFDNLIVLSANEGTFPQKQTGNSFIPHSLRYGFGLPTYEQQDAIVAYNFYRMIYRPKRIVFVYDMRTDDSNKGEVSRFVHQLRFQYGYAIKEKRVTYGITPMATVPLQKEKDAYVLEQLARFQQGGTKALSASALNTYLNCPLQFFFAHIMDMQQEQEVEESIQSNTFGSIFHGVMQNLYEGFKGREVQAHHLEELNKNQLLLQKEVARVFTKEYLKKGRTISDHEIVYPKGNHKLIADIILKYVKQMLKQDASIAPFHYVASEEIHQLEWLVDNSIKPIRLKGYIDRVHQKGNQLCIVDYKTGKGALNFERVEELFGRERKSYQKNMFQTLFYCLLYQTPKEVAVVPHLYYVRNLFDKNFTSTLIQKPDKKTSKEIDNFSDLSGEFNTALTTLLREIFDPQTPFTQCVNKENCSYCNFQKICMR